jgi:hypothetical protein
MWWTGTRVLAQVLMLLCLATIFSGRALRACEQLVKKA